MSHKPKEIFSIFSEINGFIKVVDTVSGRELRSDKDIIVTLADNHKFFSDRYWGIYTEEVRKLRNNCKRILCLGLGGGSIQNQLFKMYPGVEIVSIEIDPLMNDIHNFYFSGDRNNRHRILNIDAKIFLKYPHRFGDFDNYFDLIFVDVFSSMSLDEYQKIKDFYSHSKKLLKTNGVFSMNLIVKLENQFDESSIVLNALKNEFLEIKTVHTSDFFGVANLEIFASDKLSL